ncbi:hypothetical protein PSCICN_13100 [Pseudomonas cichorii]|nr:hypothetical protein PSCICN_13100 [Pseudomonas cichorii]
MKLVAFALAAAVSSAAAAMIRSRVMVEFQSVTEWALAYPSGNELVIVLYGPLSES